MKNVGIFTMFLGAVIMLAGLSPLIQVGGEIMIGTTALGIGIALAGLVVSRE